MSNIKLDIDVLYSLVNLFHTYSTNRILKHPNVEKLVQDVYQYCDRVHHIAFNNSFTHNNIFDNPQYEELSYLLYCIACYRLDDRPLFSLYQRNRMIELCIMIHLYKMGKIIQNILPIESNLEFLLIHCNIIDHLHHMIGYKCNYPDMWYIEIVLSKYQNTFLNNWIKRNTIQYISTI